MSIAQNAVLPFALGSSGPGAPALQLPAELDLGAHDTPAQLALLAAALAPLDAPARAQALRGLRLRVPAPAMHGRGPVLLPGGAVAWRCALEGALVCDPQSAIALGAAGAARLRLEAARLPGALTLSHEARGLVSAHGVPGALPAQACTLLPDASVLRALPGRHAPGRLLVQWRPGGAVAWRLVEAPAELALAAGLAGVSLAAGAAPMQAEPWRAEDRAARIELLSPGLYERVGDLLIDEVEDELRWAIAAHAIDIRHGLAAHLAEALSVLPAVFSADPGADDGACLLAAWPRTAARLAADPRGLALLGIESMQADGPAMLSALRAALQDSGLFCREDADALPLLGSRQAQAAAARATGFCGALIAPPAGPAELYALAETLARRLGARVVVSAPGWNFHHRIDAANGTEAGNANWFGMGAGLDELDWLF